MPEATAPTVVIVYVSCPDTAVAASLARSLVDEGLAACGSVLPGVRSIYRWQGEVQDEPEVLLLLKTQAARVHDLCARVEQLHPYDVPEAIATPVVAGLPAYLAWVADNVDTAQPS